MSERELMNQILDALNRLPNSLFMHYDNNPGYSPELDARMKRSRFVLKGAADIVGISNGKSIAIEIKLPGEKARPDQIAFLEKWKRCGGLAGVAISIDTAMDIVFKGETK